MQVETCTNYEGNKYFYSNSQIHEDHKVYVSKLYVCMTCVNFKRVQCQYSMTHCGVAYMWT
jgi:hypothetical protein